MMDIDAAAVEAKPMPSEAADYGEPYYFDLNWMSIKLTQLLLAEVTSSYIHISRLVAFGA